MREQDGLRALEVRVARHDDVGIPLGEVEDRRLQRRQMDSRTAGRLDHVHAEVGRHLVVA